RLERWRDAPLPAAVDATPPQTNAGGLTGPRAPHPSQALIGRLDATAPRPQGFEAQTTAHRPGLGALPRDAQSALQALGGEREGAPAAGPGSQVLEALLGKFGELEKMLGGFGKRLAGIDRLAGTGDAWQELRERMSGIEGRLGTQALDIAN